jgi:uncharacterized membrane protein
MRTLVSVSFRSCSDIKTLRFISIFQWSNRFSPMMPWSIWYFWDSFLAMEIVSLFCALVGHVIGLICLFVHYKSIYVRVHAVISKDKSEMNLRFVLLCADPTTGATHHTTASVQHILPLASGLGAPVHTHAHDTSMTPPDAPVVGEAGVRPSPSGTSGWVSNSKSMRTGTGTTAVLGSWRDVEEVRW